MNCVEFGFDRSRGFGSARGQFCPIAIDRPTRPYNIASTTVQQVMLLHGSLALFFGMSVITRRPYILSCKDMADETLEA
jgi:hypothetical protein